MFVSVIEACSPRTLRYGAALVLTCCALAACSQASEPVRVIRIDLGGHLNDEGNLTAASETFTPTDTVYGSIATEGTGAATLAAEWVGADGRVLAKQTQQINPTKPAHFEFHFAPSGGWPTGRHKVTFTLNGGGARTREFEVR